MTIPFITRQDPHHIIRQDARFFGKAVGRDQVVRLTDALTKLHQFEPWRSEKGELKRKHYRRGAETVKHVAACLFVEHLTAEDGAFEDIRRQYARHCWDDEAINRLYNLRRAIDEGIWTEDGVKDWNPDEVTQ